MKITYIVLKGLPLVGGIEKFTEEIGSRLANKGHSVIVYTMEHYGTKNNLYRGMQIKTIPCIKIRSLEKISASFTATLKTIFDKDINIVHFHAFGPSIFSFIPKLKGKKVVVQGHGLEWKRSKWGLCGKTFLRLSEIPSIIFPHVLTVVSKVQQKYIKKKYGRDSVYIPTGVNQPTIEQPDLIKEYGLKGNDYLLFAARLVREKGAHYLINAFNMIKTNMKLVIAGDTLYEEHYKNKIKKLSKNNKNIIFTGFATGKLLRELFSSAYLFVLPSEVEGLPTVLLEAMSYGNCCLVSDIPENLEALNNNGYTFTSKNEKSLAEMLNYLIDNPEKVESVKMNAKSYVFQNHSWNSIADKFEYLYYKLIN
ncbi:MAG: glycosyltransferase family 4 protein [Candidatus Hodarchaeota archaeon]